MVLFGSQHHVLASLASRCCFCMLLRRPVPYYYCCKLNIIILTTMKKYSSYKDLKLVSPLADPHVSKVTSPTYRKIDLQNLSSKPSQDKYRPITAKYSAYSALNKKKNSSRKKVSIPTESKEINYDDIKSRIVNLEGKLKEIQKHYSKTNRARERQDCKNQANKENSPSNARESARKTRNKTPEKQAPEGQNIHKLQRKPLTIYNIDTNVKGKLNMNSPKGVSLNVNSPKGAQKGTGQLAMNSPKSGKGSLNEYVTSYASENANAKMSQCASEINLLKKNFKSSMAPDSYYISSIVKAHQTSKPSSFDLLCRQHLQTSLDILHMVQESVRTLPSLSPREKLPPAKKPTLIFDLDETLIHCNASLSQKCDVVLPIRFPNNQVIKAGINIRPYVEHCLQELSKQFELMVFTASHECYANVIIDYLDPKRQLIAYRFFRDSCVRISEGFYVKDLRIIDRDLSQVLLIDNAAYSYCAQLDNGVPIIPFYNNKADLELKALTKYLKGFHGHKQLRSANEQQLKLSQYGQFHSASALIAKLYS